jgi:hypothetical protein
MFLSIVLGLYALANFYVFARGWTVLPRSAFVRLAYVLAGLFLMSAYVLARIIPVVASGLSGIGSWWIGAVIYLLFFTLLADLVMLLNRFVSFLPPGTKEIRLRQRRLVALLIVAVTLALLVYGADNATVLRVTTVPLRIDQPGAGVERIRLAYLSDLHLGEMRGEDLLRRVVARLEALRPDLVVLGGDVLDVELDEETARTLVEGLSRLKPAHGLYAVLGNHEYICGADRSAELLMRAGATLLRDEVARPVPNLYLAGRDDLSRRWRTGERKTLAEILSGRDERCPLIVVDHQPAQAAVAEAVQAGADLMLSGHTHAGQLFPWNWAVRIFFDKIYGLYREGSTAVYVTSGAGTWGPPVRVGNGPEIVLVEITFGGGR